MDAERKEEAFVHHIEYSLTLLVAYTIGDMKNEKMKKTENKQTYDY
jgi:hypothetical protein